MFLGPLGPLRPLRFAYHAKAYTQGTPNNCRTL